MAGKVVQLVNDLVSPILAENNLELYDLEFVKEAGQYFLRVYIDSDDGVNINDCEKVSRALSKILDQEDPIEQDYILEVSSPGLERSLKTDKHFKKYIGASVRINLYKPVADHKIYEGKLIDFDKDNLKIECEQEIFVLPRDFVSSCKLIFS